MTIELAIRLIKRNLSDDLRQKRYRNKAKFAGYCYIASEALFHMFPTLFEPMQINHEKVSHWFLRNKRTQEIVDITASQFSSIVPYASATRRAFFTKMPSKRCKEVLLRIRREYNAD